MSSDLEHSSRPAGQALANDYDSFAEAYAAETESNLINGYHLPHPVPARRSPTS
ncbi:hypothetical protein [Micromonospora sp. CB01531]|uniref:hypothetical protein n=1 Tax=Micromonospora sp. CB01531 TaxID=1718947 RepID=UPI000A4C993D|nr:hypothetical protein [Micromonospora sp. CB01531]